MARGRQAAARPSVTVPAPRTARDRRVERSCRICGCTQLRACPGGCYWVDDDLCSACAEGYGIRDPRMDPRPGDVLAIRTDVRAVRGRSGARVDYGFPTSDAVRSLPLLSWQSWARNAVIREVAT